MHVGHLRSTIIGDAISRLLEFQGHKVIRQNHIGDWGRQFGMLISHLLDEVNKTRSSLTPDEGVVRDEKGFKLADLEKFYRSAQKRFEVDPAFQKQSSTAVVRLQAGNETERFYWQVFVDETLRESQVVYTQLGVQLVDPKVQPEAIVRGESFYNRWLPEVVKELKEAGLAVESSAPVDEPEEDGVVAWTDPKREDRRIVVFIDGFKNPLIIQKTDGGYLYGTTDLAAIRYRINELHATRIIYTHDSRQAQHFALVFATAKKAGWADGVSLEYAPFGTMLGEDGKPFKTRSGDTVKLKDLLDEAEERAFKVVSEKNAELPESQRKAIAHAVGIGAVKYADLSKDRVSDYVFSFDKMLALDGNTAPYLQYAHARTRAIFRRAAERGISTDLSNATVSLESPFELALAKHILRLGEVIDMVARELKPHHLCTYLYELSTKFSGFFENCPVIQSEEPTRSSRLVLCELTARTLETGLDLLGIEHPDQM
jgi:arginyl-tRNA synthetase